MAPLFVGPVARPLTLREDALVRLTLDPLIPIPLIFMIAEIFTCSEVENVNEKCFEKNTGKCKARLK